MGTVSFTDNLFGQTRNRVFALLFAHPEQDFYVREIVGAVGSGVGSVQRELAFLYESGLLIRSRRGNQIFYRINVKHPLYPELSQIVRKTSGAEVLLRDALGKLASRVTFAAIFGSYAARQEKPNSDIDVLVVGGVEFGEVVEAFAETQRSLGREINPVVYGNAEFARKLKAGNHFLKTVVNGPMVFLWGDERELERVVRTRLDRSA